MKQACILLGISIPYIYKLRNKHGNREFNLRNHIIKIDRYENENKYFVSKLQKIEKNAN